MPHPNHVNLPNGNIVTLVILGMAFISYAVDYPVDKCISSRNCTSVCGSFEGSQPSCQLGNCICDCSQNAHGLYYSPPTQCTEKIPSTGTEKCQGDCSSKYFRASRICGKPGQYVYCTCTCDPHRSVLGIEEDLISQ